MKELLIFSKLGKLANQIYIIFKAFKLMQTSDIFTSLWASNRNPAPPGGFLETTIFGNLSHRAIEIRLPAKILVLDKAVRALFFKMAAKFQGTIFFDNFHSV